VVAALVRQLSHESPKVVSFCLFALRNLSVTPDLVLGYATSKAMLTALRVALLQHGDILTQLCAAQLLLNMCEL